MSSHQAPRDPFPFDVLDGLDRCDSFDRFEHRAAGHDAPPHLYSVRVVAFVSAVVILVGICLSFPG
jgi:hypothetical protein